MTTLILLGLLAFILSWGVFVLRDLRDEICALKIQIQTLLEKQK